MMKIWVVERLEEEMESWSSSTIKLFTNELGAQKEYEKIRKEIIEEIAYQHDLTPEEIENNETEIEDIEIEEMGRYFEVVTYETNKYTVSYYEQEVEE